MSQRFLTALRSGRVLLMDGAMGTELLRAGLSAGECGEMWNLRHADKVRDVHKAYIDAGAEVLVTNTFQAHPLRLLEAGVPATCETVVTEGLRLSFCACLAKQFALVSVGPFLPPGSSLAMLDPAFSRSFGQALRCADGILLETWSDPICLELGKMLRQWDPTLEKQPILLSLTFRRETTAEGNVAYRSFGGRQSPEWFASQALEKGFAGLGVNCGRNLAIADCADIVRRFRRETDLPLFARPNAGTPVEIGTGLVYPETADEMAKALPELLDAGANMVGGCCGTTAAHIAAFKTVVDKWKLKRRAGDGRQSAGAPPGD